MKGFDTMKAKDFNKILLDYLYDILDMFKRSVDGYYYWIECDNNTFDNIVYDINKMCGESDGLDIFIDDTKIFIDLSEYTTVKATYIIKAKIVK